ncbi:arginine biosynthesis bifunctional protein ArgJ beta chain [Aureobasidium subglaciale]|nr:arginine biosynthesis bifunctional protein ArgJ beta chain [Aureobasidium subglaciale]
MLPHKHTLLKPTTCLRRTQGQARWFSKFDFYANAQVPKNKLRFIPDNGSYPLGFSVGSIKAGIKPEASQQDDLVFIASDIASNGAAVFTKNEFAAPSVRVSRDKLQECKGHGVQGIIANAGCANLFTGRPGLEDTIKMGDEAATQLIDGETKPPIMVMHTGAGSQRLPMDMILQSMPKLREKMGNSHDHWMAAAKALLTTDTFPKMASRSFTLPNSSVTFKLAGITKGAGMIHPNMATTLGIICTDAPVTPVALQQLLSSAADKSYNCISIEGDTSTNDMVVMLANGAAGGDVVDFDPSAHYQSDDFVALQKILIEYMAELAKLVVRDGEGATKFVTIRIKGAPSYPAGKRIASVIARSVLLKTALYGKDSGWGNVAVALGYSLADTEFAAQGIVVPESTSISLVLSDGSEMLKLFDKGIPANVDQDEVKKHMDQEDIEILVNLRDAEESQHLEEATYWTCDITHEFIEVNSDFRT